MVRKEFGSADVTVTRLRGGILIVRVAAFTRGVGREVRTAVSADNSDHARGIVLDLRDNPGGLLDEAVELASVFLDGGPVVSLERRGQAPQTLSALTKGDTATPLVVLVDHATASAAEIVAAALQERSRAVVVGSRTYGKGSVQEPSKLSDGSAIELTVGHYRTPSGRSIDGVGVDPDVLVPDGSTTLAERRAVDVLSGLLAALGVGGRG
jgi:carboxyl-terminal processing protease